MSLIQKILTKTGIKTTSNDFVVVPDQTKSPDVEIEG